jgi:hypothetical protein
LKPATEGKILRSKPATISLTTTKTDPAGRALAFFARSASESAVGFKLSKEGNYEALNINLEVRVSILDLERSHNHKTTTDHNNADGKGFRGMLNLKHANASL